MTTEAKQACIRDPETALNYKMERLRKENAQERLWKERLLKLVETRASFESLVCL